MKTAKDIFWFGIAEEGAGLVRKHQQSNNFTHYRHNPGDTTSFSTGEVYRIYEDNSGNLCGLEPAEAD